MVIDFSISSYSHPTRPVLINCHLPPCAGTTSTRPRHVSNGEVAQRLTVQHIRGMPGGPSLQLAPQPLPPPRFVVAPAPLQPAAAMPGVRLEAAADTRSDGSGGRGREASTAADRTKTAGLDEAAAIEGEAADVIRVLLLPCWHSRSCRLQCMPSYVRCNTGSRRQSPLQSCGASHAALQGLLLSHAHTGSGQPASSSRTARQDTLLACRFATNFSDDYELGECIGKGTLRSHTRGLDMQCSSHCVLASHAGGVMSHEKRMVWRCA